MADTTDLNPVAFERVGSTPTSPTNLYAYLIENAVEMPAEFASLVDEHFWELVDLAETD